MENGLLREAYFPIYLYTGIDGVQKRYIRRCEENDECIGNRAF